MNELRKISLIIISAIAFISCNTGMKGDKVETGEAIEMGNKEIRGSEYTINTEKSIIEWLGTKPTGEHVGTVNLKQGNLIVQDGKIVTGKFTIDKNSIVNKDLTDPEWNQKLVDHLKSPDFFNTSEYPESTFEIVEVKVYDGPVNDGDVSPTHWITGNLTMKNITRSITFPASIRLENDQLVATTSQFVIDRTEWDIRYQSKKFFSELKDKFIYDEIGLKISLSAQPI